MSVRPFVFWKFLCISPFQITHQTPPNIFCRLALVPLWYFCLLALMAFSASACPGLVVFLPFGPYGLSCLGVPLVAPVWSFAVYGFVSIPSLLSPYLVSSLCICDVLWSYVDSYVIFMLWRLFPLSRYDFRSSPANMQQFRFTYSHMVSMNRIH